MQPNEPFRPGPPPSFWGRGPQGPQLPKAPKILGVLSIVFGSIVAAFSVYGVFSSGGGGLRFTEGLPPRAIEALDRFVAETRVASTIQSGAFLIMSLALIWIGMQQRKYREVAVKASIVWGAIALVVLVAATFQQMFVFAPAMERFMDTLAEYGAPNIYAGGMGKLISFLSLVLYAPYPIVLIVTFRKPQIVGVMKE
jgi:hypothetical protein